MKIGSYRAITREEVKQAPSWIEVILRSVNSAFEKIYQALQHRLTFQDNFNAEDRSITLTDQEEVDVQMQTITGKVKKAYVVWSDNYEFVTGWKAKVLDEKTVRVSVKWAIAPAQASTVIFRFEGD